MCDIKPLYIYDIIWILCDITTILSDIKRRYSWHHIHTIPEYRPIFLCSVCMLSHVWFFALPWTLAVVKIVLFLSEVFPK